MASVHNKYNDVIKEDMFSLGSYHFLPEGGGRLSVICGSPIFSGPPLGMRKKFLVPPSACTKNSGPPLAYAKKFWSPPLVKEQPLT